MSSHAGIQAFRTDTLARIHGIEEQRVLDWIADKELTARRDPEEFGGRWRVPVTALPKLRALIEGREVCPKCQDTGRRKATWGFRRCECTEVSV